MKYIGSSHNLWHRMTLSLEEMAINLPGSNSMMNYNQFVDDSDSNLNNVSFVFLNS